MFIDNIPDSLREHPNTASFITLMDEVLRYKHSIVSESLRVYNPALCMDKKWLFKWLDEYGFSDIPYEYPIEILQQLLLNIETVYRLRGSKIGIELFASTLSFGEVTVDDSDFYGEPSLLILDSKKQGVLVGKSEDKEYFLCNNSSLLNSPVTLGVTVKSKYFGTSQGELIKEYIRKTLPYFIPFSPNRTINITFQSRSTMFYHKLLNKYFV